MTTYFTYHLYNKITDQHYYGARWAKGCHPDDLWVTYFTSSKRVKELIEQYGKESFTHKIRKIFNSEEECRKWERRVLIKLKIKSNSRWLNTGICAAPPRPIGYKHSEETKAKMRKPKGPWSEERKEAKRQEMLAKIAKGEHVVPGTKGYKHRPEVLAKMKTRIPWNKGKTGVQTAWNKGLRGDTRKV